MDQPARIEAPRHERTRRTATPERSDNQFVVRALAKGLAMLGLFDAEHREWSLDEMTAELGLPRMTSYRMARTLQSAGYLVTDDASGKYRLGPALLAATYLSEGYADLVALARPYLESLVEQTEESVTLAVEVDGVAVCVAMLDSPRPHRREVAVGRVIGDTANSHGKMFAACKPDAEQGAHRQAPVHERHTVHTITEPRRARAHVGGGETRGRRLRHRGARHRHLLRGRSGARSDGRGHRDAGRRRADGPLRPGGEGRLRGRRQGHRGRVLRLLRVRRRRAAPLVSPATPGALAPAAPQRPSGAPRRRRALLDASAAIMIWQYHYAWAGGSPFGPGAGLRRGDDPALRQ